MKRKKVVIFKTAREGGPKGQGVDDLRKDEFEEFNMTTDATVRFPAFETES